MFIIGEFLLVVYLVDLVVCIINLANLNLKTLCKGRIASKSLLVGFLWKTKI